MAIKKNNFCLLAFSTFLHLFSSICAFYLDSYRWPSGYKEINYWCNFLSYWSVQASLVTIVYFIYRLFKKSPTNYFDKIFDLLVINANVTSIGIFTISVIGRWTLAPQREGMINIFSFPVNRKIFWWFYSTLWHYLAPLSNIAYFTRRKTSLVSTYFGRRRLFWYSFIHPFFYVLFVLFRPYIPGSEFYQFGSRNKKSLYPYFFFGWVKHGKNNIFLWFFLVISIIFLGLLIFWTSTLFFWWFAGYKLKNKIYDKIK
ncbi:hypothetical protein [endosymbiont GvMRE of Glomus versiforme]|uniref:hypothetical protein n=1 Tax=endosymbiont GvMRE of Glomus versiforme TaxID=2039283 RepID=UPI000ED0DFD1|nr:hypothetical protein [endosymbiont GvMRE of Glomus versiforme]RHZ35277.1 hypothetical protein GvMRE_IIg281 [endosymbiont GvMRE of Glomus versiforme]